MLCSLLLNVFLLHIYIYIAFSLFICMYECVSIYISLTFHTRERVSRISLLILDALVVWILDKFRWNLIPQAFYIYRPRNVIFIYDAYTFRGFHSYLYWFMLYNGYRIPTTHLKNRQQCEQHTKKKSHVNRYFIFCIQCEFRFFAAQNLL